MRYQIMKQYIAVQDNEPTNTKRDVWVAILPDTTPPDKENIYQFLDTAELAVEQKIERQNEQDELGNDQVDKFGLKIKARRYKIIEIE